VLRSNLSGNCRSIPTRETIPPYFLCNYKLRAVFPVSELSFSFAPYHCIIMQQTILYSFGFDVCNRPSSAHRDLIHRRQVVVPLAPASVKCNSAAELTCIQSSGLTYSAARAPSPPAASPRRDSVNRCFCRE